jgi:DNA-binding transcriptional LysR family regulator
LRSFAVFADHLNFTKAAQELHISQPALHVKVVKLAAAVGSTLYIRDGRRLELTAAGKSLAAFAPRIRAELEGFLVGLAEPEAPLVLAAGDGAHRYVLARAVRLLIERGARLRLLSTDRDETVDAVRSGRAALGVTVVDVPPAGLGCVTLATYPQLAVFAAGYPLGRRRALKLKDLHGADMILPPPGRPQRAALDRASLKAGVTWNVAAEAEGWAPALHFAALGVGVALVNGCVEVPPRTVARPVSDLPAVTYSALFLKADQASAAVRRLLETVQANLP